MASVVRFEAAPSAAGGRTTATPAGAAELDDAALVTAAQADPRAFAPLYRRYVGRVYGYCFRRLGSREAAEDATGAVFARALAALPRYRAGERDGSFRAWLFAIAHNVAVNEVRAARPSGPLDAAGEVADPATGPEEAALTGETRMLVRGLLPALPAEQRRVIELRLAGLTEAEIARALDRSPGSVRVAQFRAIARMRELLRETGRGEGRGA